MVTLPVASPRFSIDEVVPAVFRITEPHCRRLIQANCFFTQGTTADLLVDSGMGVAPLRPVIAALSDKPLILFTTHTHIDHVGSHPEFCDAEILVHPLEADELRRPGGKGLGFPPQAEEQLAALRKTGIEIAEFMADAAPYDHYDIEGYGRAPTEPTRLVDDRDVIDIGGRRFDVLHLPGHSAGGIALWEASTGLRFSSDVNHGAIIDTAPTSNVADDINTMRRLKDLPVALLVDGHKDSMNLGRMIEIADHYFTSKETAEPPHHASQASR